MKYLLAVDGSDQSVDAIRVFEALAPAESLKVLHVVHVPGVPYPAVGANVAQDLAMTVESMIGKKENVCWIKRCLFCLCTQAPFPNNLK